VLKRSMETNMMILKRNKEMIIILILKYG